MKKTWKIGLLTATFCLSIITLLQSADTICAKSKSKVTYTLKNGTLTVKGKGKIPASFKIRNKKKVKKIVIKNGITSIPIEAFDDCKNVTEITVAKSVKSIGQYAFYTKKQLKKVTLPGKFSILIEEGDMAANTIFSGNGAETVVFNTNLDLKVLNSILCENYETKTTDPNYKSIDGVIYSKDGKDIVRVPYLKEKLVIAQGTENFCLYSILHSTEDWEGDPLYSCQIKEIILPASIKTVEIEKYKPTAFNNEFGELKFTIHTKQLDGRALSLLYSWLGEFDEDDSLIKNIAEQLPEQISLVNDMYITKDGVLLTYIGKGEEVTVPEQVTVIGDRAFSYTTTLTKVQLPEGLTEIGNYAFSECMDWQDDSKTWEINIPSTVTAIGDYAFHFASIKEFILPENLKTLGKYAFSDTPIQALIIPDGITKIPEGLCRDCSSLKTVTFAKNISRIGDHAFMGCPLAPFNLSAFSSLKQVGYFAFDTVEWSQLRLPASLKKANTYAFAKATEIVVPKECTTISAICGTCPTTTFKFKSTPKYWNTSFYFKSAKFRKGKVTANLVWNKIEKSGAYKKIGYQIVLSKDAKCKKILKKITLTKNVNKLTTSFKNKDIEVYGKIRPFVMKNGKKVFGKWSKIETNI